MHMAQSGGTSGAHVGADALPIKDLGDATSAAFVVVGSDVFLQGSTSLSSGCHAFPARDICPDTGARDMKPARFGPRGTLYSYACVHVSASRPVPYAIGYVDFPEGLRALLPVQSQAALDGALPCDAPVVLRVDGDRVVAVPLDEA